LDFIRCYNGRRTGALVSGGGPSSGNYEILKPLLPIGF
jgi:hypothetical protein